MNGPQFASNDYSAAMPEAEPQILDMIGKDAEGLLHYATSLAENAEQIMARLFGPQVCATGSDQKAVPPRPPGILNTVRERQSAMTGALQRIEQALSQLSRA